MLRSGDIDSVVFICHGNVCRSPYAAASFSRAALGRSDIGPIRVTSAGFIGPGRMPPEAALGAAQRRNFDVSTHRSTLITPEIIRNAGLVVVMSAEQAAMISARYRHAGLRVLVLGDLDPQPIATRTVTDPWGRSDEVFDAVFDRIDRCVSAMVSLLADRGVRSSVPAHSGA